MRLVFNTTQAEVQADQQSIISQNNHPTGIRAPRIRSCDYACTEPGFYTPFAIRSAAPDSILSYGSVQNAHLRILAICPTYWYASISYLNAKHTTGELNHNRYSHFSVFLIYAKCQCLA